jgi:hypothetical protein
VKVTIDLGKVGMPTLLRWLQDLLNMDIHLFEVMLVYPTGSYMKCDGRSEVERLYQALEVAEFLFQKDKWKDVDATAPGQ